MVNNIVFRNDIINELIKKNNYTKYLEIGVRDPNHCFNHINCMLKHGVDPGYEGEYEATFRMTSDEFFSSNVEKYDLIFIDGCHIDEQVEKDIYNSLKFLNHGGTIVLHDCSPPNVYYQRENFHDLSTPASIGWCGTVWKAVVKVRSEIDGIYTSVVDTDFGVGIINRRTEGNKIQNDNLYFSYEKFDKNRKFYLNLISIDEFVENYLIKNVNDQVKK